MTASGAMVGRRSLLAGTAALAAGGSLSAQALTPARCPTGDAAWIPSEDLVRDIPRLMRVAGVPGVAIGVVDCQTAFKRDPRSASKRDPLFG